MGRYKVTGTTAVLDAEPGSVLEHDFSEADEADLLERGRLSLEPRPYQVAGNCDFVTDDGSVHAPGDTFETGLAVGRERALLEGGHLERVSPKKRPKAADPKKEQ